MQFTMTINIKGAEVEEDVMGPQEVVARWLVQVAKRVQDGHMDAGIIRDVNGNKVGQYKTED